MLYLLVGGDGVAFVTKGRDRQTIGETVILHAHPLLQMMG
jgi:hypothetical protein